MFAVLDNRRETSTTRQNLLESLLRECQQTNQPLLNELLQYYFQTESSNALQLIKLFNDAGKEQSKVRTYLNSTNFNENNSHRCNLRFLSNI